MLTAFVIGDPAAELARFAWRVSRSGVLACAVTAWHGKGAAAAGDSATMDEDTRVTAAIIAAAVSLIGTVLTTALAVLAARWQIRAKLDELAQTQLKDVLAKRIEAYPQLWDVAQTNLSDWQRAGKPVDANWARNFFARLNQWHAAYGVFLSQRAYERFVELRERTLAVVQKCDKGGVPTLEDLCALDDIYTGVATAGLATWLKNDLGSYKTPALAVAS